MKLNPSVEFPESIILNLISLFVYVGKTRSVFANDKFVKLMQDVTRQRKIFEK